MTRAASASSSGDSASVVLFGQWAQPQGHCIPGGERAAQRCQVRAGRFRAPAGHRQKWQLCHRPAEPAPHRETGFVGPLQVVDGKHHRRRCAQSIDPLQQPFHGRQYRIGQAELTARSDVLRVAGRHAFQ